MTNSTNTDLKEYQVLGRKLPTATEANPKVYRMRIFAPNEVVAKSRFWYFLKKASKIKKASGEIIGVDEIPEKDITTVKNYGIWLRYESRTGVHNMYKEYRDVSRVDAVHLMYNDMNQSYHALFRNIHILRVVVLTNDEVKRPYVRQLLADDLKFPLTRKFNHLKSLDMFTTFRPKPF